MRFLSIIRNAGIFVFYLDYLWHDMQMSRAMNIKDGRVCRGAVFDELGDRWARALVPSVLRQGPGRVKDTCRPTRGPQGGGGPEEGWPGQPLLSTPTPGARPAPSLGCQGETLPQLRREEKGAACQLGAGFLSY